MGLEIPKPAEPPPEAAPAEGEGDKAEEGKDAKDAKDKAPKKKEKGGQ